MKVPPRKTTTRRAARKRAAATRAAAPAVGRGRSRKAGSDGIADESGDGAEPAPPGGRSLVIVESPAKAKTIGKYLGRAYQVKATVGHVRDLPEKKLGIDVDRGFEPEYVTIAGTEKTLADLKNAAKESREIFIATDPDREGEAIAWHVAGQIRRRGGAPIRRVLFHEITKDAIEKAIAAAGVIDEKKVEAQQARRVLDRLVGYKASPVLWKTVKKGLSAGRGGGVLEHRGPAGEGRPTVHGQAPPGGREEARDPRRRHGDTHAGRDHRARQGDRRAWTRHHRIVCRHRRQAPRAPQEPRGSIADGN